jgi:hypothetical protein
VASSGEKKNGDKGGNIAITKLVQNITFFQNIECGTLSHNSPHAIQDLSVY